MVVLYTTLGAVGNELLYQAQGEVGSSIRRLQRVSCVETDPLPSSPVESTMITPAIPHHRPVGSSEGEVGVRARRPGLGEGSVKEQRCAGARVARPDSSVRDGGGDVVKVGDAHGEGVEPVMGGGGEGRT